MPTEKSPVAELELPLQDPEVAIVIFWGANAAFGWNQIVISFMTSLATWSPNSTIMGI